MPYQDLMNNLSENSKIDNVRELRFADLFSGIGGFHQAASQTGARCVFASEIDPVLRSYYEKRYAIEPAGDIRNVDPNNVPEHDLLCAGFPCQPFSKAGSQLGWEDAIRGTLFFNIIQILEARKPQYVILENVAHFVRHDEGNTYQKVKSALEALGYTVDSKTLSPHQFGIPQIRERMYLVGKIGGLNGFEWPTETTQRDDLSIKEILDTNPAGARKLSDRVITCLEVWQEFLEIIPKNVKIVHPLWSMEFGASYPYSVDSLEAVPLKNLRKTKGCFGQTLDTWFRKEIMKRVPSYARRHAGVFPKWKQRFILNNRNFYKEYKEYIDPWLPKIRKFPPSFQKLEWNCLDDKRDIWEYVIQFRASGVRVKRATTSPSLVAMTSTQIPIIGWERRYMTFKECSRLQSIEGFKSLPTISATISSLGNAVNVKVAKMVLEKLIN